MTRLKKYIVEFIENAEQWEKVQNKYPMIKSAVKIIINITNMGYKAYLVGGAIRDIVLGDEPHDVDICGNASLDEIRKMFDTYDLSGEEFGIIGIKLDGHTYEYAQFRSDGKYADGRKPEKLKCHSKRMLQDEILALTHLPLIKMAILSTILMVKRT